SKEKRKDFIPEFEVISEEIEIQFETTYGFRTLSSESFHINTPNSSQINLSQITALGPSIILNNTSLSTTTTAIKINSAVSNSNQQPNQEERGYWNRLFENNENNDDISQLYIHDRSNQAASKKRVYNNAPDGDLDNNPNPNQIAHAFLRGLQ
ncbi:13437_t:CDS:2, partial [Gigaspora margarita]